MAWELGMAWEVLQIKFRAMHTCTCVYISSIGIIIEPVPFHERDFCRLIVMDGGCVGFNVGREAFITDEGEGRKRVN